MTQKIIKLHLVCLFLHLFHFWYVPLLIKFTTTSCYYILHYALIHLFIQDNLTDIIYLITNVFANLETFYLFLFFFILPYLVFIQSLYNKKAGLKFRVVTMGQYFFYEKYDELYKVIYTGTRTHTLYCTINYLFKNCY